jgi:hypothetical protein
MVRVASKVGINRIAKNIVPSLAEYLRSKDAQPEADDAERDDE